MPEPPKSVECVACLDRTHQDNALKAPCGDIYCNDCLEKLYYDCMKDESLFPPRCCQKEFPCELVRHHLSQQCRSKFGSKRKELETKDRTYCHIPTCSAKTCVLCKQEEHEGDCPTDETLQQTECLARRQNWQRCPGCNRLVELTIGCNHMT